MPLPESAAAERNKAAILDVLRGALPARGTVLEIASGTGQHVVHFAAAMPTLTWQPSDADRALLEVLAARVREAALPNVLAPVAIDVHDARWSGPGGPFAALVCINMIHIAPWSATEALFRNAKAHLAPAAPLYIYGPFLEAGDTAPSNLAFDRALRSEDPSWGVRDLAAVTDVAVRAGFAPPALTRMPANNLSLVFRAPQ